MLETIVCKIGTIIIQVCEHLVRVYITLALMIAAWVISDLIMERFFKV